MANLYTKTGDRGQTGLVGGSRVGKDDPRVECYGTVDEANSMLGLAASQAGAGYLRDTVRHVQGRLFALGAELASDEKGAARLKDVITAADVAYLEAVVDKCTETTGKQTHFVIPGVDPVSAALHCARTIIRRAERHMVALSQTRPVREDLARYANRLSDALYALARLQETVVEAVRKTMAAPAEGQKGGNMPPFTLETLRAMALRAEERANEIGVPMVFSAVDAGGNLVLFQRMPGSLMGSIDVSMGKAYTANAFKMPTEELAKAAAPGGPLYGLEANGSGRAPIVLFGGGYPYVVDGEVVGGVGVSGGTVEQDMDVARYALSL